MPSRAMTMAHNVVKSVKAARGLLPCVQVPEDFFVKVS